MAWRYLQPSPDDYTFSNSFDDWLLSGASGSLRSCRDQGYCAECARVKQTNVGEIGGGVLTALPTPPDMRACTKWFLEAERGRTELFERVLLGGIPVTDWFPWRTM